MHKQAFIDIKPALSCMYVQIIRLYLDLFQVKLRKNMQEHAMLLAERHQFILDQLNLQGRITSVSLAQTLDVSEDTIRRDLNKLAELKLLRRVHGGALALQDNTPDYIERLDKPDTSKIRYIEPALAMLVPGQTIVIDSGETCRYLAQHLPKNMPLTVVTGCPLIAKELAYHSLVDVIVLGGPMFKPAMRVVGMTAIEMVKRIRFDIVFMGICSFHIHHGFSASYIEEAEILSATIRQSDHTVIMGPSHKLDKVATYQIVTANEIDTIITDEEINPSLKKQIESLEIALTLV